MRKLFVFVALACFIVGTSFAQKLSYGPKIGINFANHNYSYKDSDEEPYTNFRVGPAIGFTLNYQFNDWLALQPSLMYSKKGAAWDLKKYADESDNISSFDGYSRIRTGWLEVPINVAAGLNVGDGQIQAHVGPTISFGLHGNWKEKLTVHYTNGETEDIDENYEIKFKNSVSEGDWDDQGEDFSHFQKGIDVGLNFGLGFRCKHLLFNAGYQMGLTNQQPKYENGGDNYDPKDYKYTNQVIYANMSYLFGGDW
jgi:hypothetical protein